MEKVSDFVRAYSRVLTSHEQQTSGKTRRTMPIVVSREIGSGGALIAQALALRLGFELCDREILNAIAKSAHVPPDIVELLDEKPGSALSMFGTSILRGDSLNMQDLDKHLKMTVRKLLELGSVVILGRGGVFLAQPGQAFRLRVVAPLDVRVQNLVERLGMSEKDARAKVLHTDSERKKFHQRLFGRSEAQDDSYDLAINTHCLDLDKAVHVALYVYGRLVRDANAITRATSTA